MCVCACVYVCAKETGKEKEKKIDRNPLSLSSVCSILDYNVRLSISCTMYKVTTSFEVNVPSTMNVVFQSLDLTIERENEREKERDSEKEDGRSGRSSKRVIRVIAIALLITACFDAL